MKTSTLCFVFLFLLIDTNNNNNKNNNLLRIHHLPPNKKKQRYWDPVYMSQNFEFAGAAPPGVGETWELVWKGRVEMSFTWGCCNGITYPDGMTFSGWVQTLNAIFRFFFFFGGGGTSGKILFVASYLFGKIACKNNVTRLMLMI